MIELKVLNHMPDLLGIHQKNPAKYPFLLSSADNSGEQARFDILFAFPQQKIECFNYDCKDLLNLLDALDVSKKYEEMPVEMPFYGGWFFYFAYEYAQQVEPSLQLKKTKLPVAIAQRIPAGFVIDNQQQQAYCFCETEFKQLMPEMLAHSHHTFSQQAQAKAVSVLEEDENIYLKAITKAKQYIKDGDIFQANLSRLWQIELSHSISSAQCFKQLMNSNPAPFSALVNLGEYHIVSSSPERLIKIKQARANTRPIAGTHPRGINSQLDTEMANNLLKHPKEQAEHIMLIDLERNDLGRFCKPGSICVDELMTLESYTYVHHIVSNVSGDIQDKTSLKQALHAVFPGGTITGCPKVRCMQIIEELERYPRECYTGSVGYLNYDGSGDFNILIRTILHKENTIEFKAGAGIVADSDPIKELAETRHKAKGMLRAFA